MTTREQSGAVREHLLSLCDKAQGNLTADAVVAEATNEASPLHHLFEWDDAKAAHAHRLDQARILLRGIHVRIETHRETYEVPAFCRNPSTSRGYALVSTLRSDKARAREALLREFVNARGALERARSMAVALGLEVEIERLLLGVLDLTRATEEAEALE
jgi:hypothetical protein